MPDTQISEKMVDAFITAFNSGVFDRAAFGLPLDERCRCKQCLQEEAEARKTARAALEAALSGHVVGWRTMDSAPKDGTDIMLAAIDQVFRGEPMPDRVTVGHWTTDDECREVIGDCGGECRCPEYKFHEPSWVSWDGGFTEENPPTHWQPLPAPPVQEMEG